MIKNHNDRVPLYISVVVAPEAVTVSGARSGVAGALHTLTCTVILPRGVELSHPPNIQWQGLDTPSPVRPVKRNNRDYISTLNVTLDTVRTVYTCIASYTLNGVSSQTVEDSISISITSELTWYALLDITNLHITCSTPSSRGVSER